LESRDNVLIQLDTLIGRLRGDQDFRLASMLHQQLHIAVWTTDAERLVEVHRVLRAALDSRVALHTTSTAIEMQKTAAAIAQYIKQHQSSP